MQTVFPVPFGRIANVLSSDLPSSMDLSSTGSRKTAVSSGMVPFQEDLLDSLFRSANSEPSIISTNLVAEVVPKWLL